uniref:Uncharacterized protein n=1 Tax=Rhizophora mucronata TaxID=61149 RepID=A0A2P2NMP7_RHIMU
MSATVTSKCWLRPRWTGRIGEDAIRMKEMMASRSQLVPWSLQCALPICGVC